MVEIILGLKTDTCLGSEIQTMKICLVPRAAVPEDLRQILVQVLGWSQSRHTPGQL